MSDELVITNIYVWANGMVMTFDQYGHQMPDYQGPVEDVLDTVRQDAPSTAQWHGGNWRGKETWPITVC